MVSLSNHAPALSTPPLGSRFRGNDGIWGDLPLPSPLDSGPVVERVRALRRNDGGGPWLGQQLGNGPHCTVRRYRTAFRQSDAFPVYPHRVYAQGLGPGDVGL